MVAQKRYMIFVGVLVLAGAGIYAKRGKSHRNKCTTRESCLENEKCQCYCSGIAGYRDKVVEDEPVYIEGNDYVKDNKPVHCFCKQWDIDKFPGPAERD